ncbi:MAG: putative pyridoxamine 5-phosphate oxidase [Microbacterium sp.]|jgi:pyridoxamine 5'-phosphate oxidase|uniref:pyridoxine/pyridoxamine 5'-phosphate oxidase n=1 Tax=Microbacterium sp. TaxID=51671 RepID=UPI00262E0C2C|nr:pyridoxamine 5'-phosphate oxidase family protein [Microbacterium sp.]MDF2561124.1 putative pyridoxamine 5-phosphate oxidase [Microbacterium sp.]
METDNFAHWLRAQPSLVGSAPPFDPTALPSDPNELFRTWLVEAAGAGVPEPHAATLSTVDLTGKPDARTLILKDVGSRGWAVAGLRSSAKGAQLTANPVAALNFWWQPIVRAVRVRGSVREATREESATDLAARSMSARSGVEPGDWVLWRVEPVYMEFWQGAPDRRHTRVVYDRAGGTWKQSQIGGEGAIDRFGEASH